jgi:hypothetical protein
MINYKDKLESMVRRSEVEMNLDKWHSLGIPEFLNAVHHPVFERTQHPVIVVSSF